MKKLCLILTISILPTLGFTQHIGDTVIIYVDNRVEIKVAIPDFTDLKTQDKTINALNAFEKLIPAIVDQLSSESADLVKYSVGSTLTVEPGDPKFTYLIKNEELNNTGFRDRAIIDGEDFKIYITTSDLSKINDSSLSSCLEKITDLLPEKFRWSKSLYYQCIDDEIKLIEDKNNEWDVLELSLGAGAGLVRKEWIPDLSFKVRFGFNYKGVMQGPYVSSNLIFDFDIENKINMNAFLNVGYQWSLNKETDRQDMLGVELGYLVSQQGDLFGKNTFKLGFNWSPVKLVTVNPHVYITDDFKTAFPGIRIGFGL